MQAIRHFENDSPEMSESKEFAAAMIILSAKARIYWRLVVMHEVIWTDHVPTAGTDGIYIYINPAFFMGLPSDSQRAFLLGHEVGHMILRHPQRGKAFRKRGYFRIVKGSKIPFDHKTYNCAGDYVINADLVAHGLEPIPSGLFDDRFTRDHLVDEVYAELYEEQQQESDDQQESDQQESDDTAGDESEASDSAESSESSESGESGKSDDESGDESSESGDESGESGDEAGDESGSEHEGHDVHLEPKYDGTAEEVAEAEREDERALDKSVKDGAEQQQQAIKEGEHADVTFGDGVAGSLRAAQERKSAPLTWSDELADLLHKSGKGSETSWAKIHRRRFNLHGVVSPVTKGALNQIAFVVDVSWSVDRDALSQCMHVLADVIDELQPAGGAVVVFCGDSYEGHAEVFSGAELLELYIPDGGGTYMTAGIKWLEDNGYDPDVTLVFTDAEMVAYDMEYVVESGAVIVLDGPPTTYARWVIQRVNPRVITVADESVAA